MLRKQLKLKCDWNTASFCVTFHHYNASDISWATVQRHLLGYKDNLSLDIS